jgi:hypothetical protein
MAPQDSSGPDVIGFDPVRVQEGDTELPRLPAQILGFDRLGLPT